MSKTRETRPVGPLVRWAGIMGLLLLVGSMVPRFMTMSQANETVFSNVPLQLTEKLTKVTVGGEELTPEHRTGKQFSIFQGKDPAAPDSESVYWARLPSPKLWQHKVYEVTVTPEGENATDEVLQVLVLPRLWAFVAALGGLLLLYALPLLLGGDRDFWKELIKEPSGGYSLSKTQLLIFFFPTAAILFGLSAPQLELTFNSSMMVLLGMSGVTSALGAAASPSEAEVAEREAKANQDPEVQQLWKGTVKPAVLFILSSIKQTTDKYRASIGTGASDFDQVAAAVQQLGEKVATEAGDEFPTQQPAADEEPEASWKDLVTDWQDQGDMTRYQYFLLALLGALVLTAMAAATLQVPVLPNEFLGLLGASQVAYLATKGVKEFKASQS